MPDKPETKSGIFKRPIHDPEPEPEVPPQPRFPPEYKQRQMPDAGATTGIMPVVTEGEDPSAERDRDHATGK